MPGDWGPCAVAVGIFDGLHLGHQVLLGRAQALAQADGIKSLVYSFHPHPAQVLAPDLAPRLIESVAQRTERFEAMGFSGAVIEPFNREFAAISPKRFAQDILFEHLHAKHVVVGEGFTFGHQQRGNVAMLQAMGVEHGFEVHPVDHVKVEGLRVSSSKIREFVARGKMRGAAMLLGRRFELRGTVVRGAERGSTIGFPTANLQVESELMPHIGVYAAYATGAFGSQRAVVNVGVAPTFEVGELKVEAHLLDHSGADLYDQPLTLAFVERIRDEKRFEGIEDLKAQIAVDIAVARKIFDREA